MHISKQITLIVWLFIAAIVSAVVFGIVFIRGIGTMQTADNWLRHSAQVKAQIDGTRDFYADAETSGRLSIVDVNARPHLPDKRRPVLEKLEVLKNLVRDNPSQTHNAETLSRAINAKFSSQDKQIAAVKSDGNGKIISDVNLAIESIETQNAAVNAFEMIKATENAVFVERYEVLSESQWRIVYAMIVLLVAFVCSVTSAFYFTYRTLKRGAYTASVLRTEVLSQTNGDKVVSIPAEKIQGLIAEIEQSGKELVNV